MAPISFLLWNIANSDQKHGAKTIESRRPKIYKRLDKLNRDVVGLIELGPKDVRTSWVQKFVSRGNYAVVNSRWSQGIFIKKDRGIKAKTSYQIPLDRAYLGHTRYLLGQILSIDKEDWLVVTFHLEYRKSLEALSVRNSQFEQVLEQTHKIAKRAKIPLDRVVLMGDENGGLNKLSGPWTDAVRRAKKVTHPGHKSTRSWSGQSERGAAVDKIRVHRTGKKYVVRSNNHTKLPAGLSDHNPQSIKINRRTS